MSIRRTVLEMRLSCIVLLYVGVSLTIGTCSASSTRDEKEMQDAAEERGNGVKTIPMRIDNRYSGPCRLLLNSCTGILVSTPGGSRTRSTFSESSEEDSPERKATPGNLLNKADTRGMDKMRASCWGSAKVTYNLLYPSLPRYAAASPECQYSMAATGENAGGENAVSYKRFVPQGHDQYYDKLIYFATLVQIVGYTLGYNSDNKIAWNSDLYTQNPFTIFDEKSLCDEFNLTNNITKNLTEIQTKWKKQRALRLRRKLIWLRRTRMKRVRRNMAENERVVIYYLAKMKELNIEIQFDRVVPVTIRGMSNIPRDDLLLREFMAGEFLNTDVSDDAAVERLRGTLMKISQANLELEQIRMAISILEEINDLRKKKKNWDEILLHLRERTEFIESFPQIKDGQLLELDLSDDANVEFLMKTLCTIRKGPLEPEKIRKLTTILLDIQSAIKFLENWDEELFYLTERIEFTQSLPQKYSDPMNSNGAIETDDFEQYRTPPRSLPTMIEFTASFPEENADFSRILGDVRDTFEQHLRTEYINTGDSLRHVNSSAIQGKSEKK